jgi:hypothetical protein
MFFVSGFTPIDRENHIIKLFPICLRFGLENGKISNSDISSVCKIIKCIPLHWCYQLKFE